jgi:hypothetical protein
MRPPQTVSFRPTPEPRRRQVEEPAFRRTYSRIVILHAVERPLACVYYEPAPQGIRFVRRAPAHQH